MRVFVLVLLGDALCVLASALACFVGYCAISLGGDFLFAPQPRQRPWLLVPTGLVVALLGCGGFWVEWGLWQHRAAWSLTTVRLRLPAHFWLASVTHCLLFAALIYAGVAAVVRGARGRGDRQPANPTPARRAERRRQRKKRRRKRR